MSKIDDVVCDELNSNKEKTIMNIKTVSFMPLVRDLIGEGHAIASRLTSVKANGWHRAVDAWYTATQGKDLKDTCIVNYKRMVEVALELTMLQTKVANLQATIASLESRLTTEPNGATIIVEELTAQTHPPLEIFEATIKYFNWKDMGMESDSSETVGICTSDFTDDLENHPQDNDVFFYCNSTPEEFLKNHTKELSKEEFYVVEDAD
jgi:hypothetical protein